jgi:hypothetical protein
MHRLKVIPNFLIVDYGGMWISPAKGHLTPEMRLPVGFCTCFVDNYRLSCTVSTLLALFLSPKMAERRFRPLGGVLDRK